MASGTRRKFSDDHLESASTRPRLEIQSDLNLSLDLLIASSLEPSPEKFLQILATRGPGIGSEPPQKIPAPRRNRRNPSPAPGKGKPLNIEPPFPWATDHRATVYSLNNLLQRGINTISGDLQCKRCERQYQIEYDLQDKFLTLADYVAKNKFSFHDRAPATWMNPTLPSCMFCKQENSVKPMMAEKKKSINWLFLLLGQMLGCCTLEQLKYFCKHTKNHRTGAKDRVLFLTYLGLCKQLDPTGPFDRS